MENFEALNMQMRDVLDFFLEHRILVAFLGGCFTILFLKSLSGVLRAVLYVLAVGAVFWFFSVKKQAPEFWGSASEPPVYESDRFKAFPLPHDSGAPYEKRFETENG